MTYFEKLQDPRWQKKRLHIMERDGFACRDCKATNKTLHVHHCFYERGGPWETPEYLLLTLCSDCHLVRQSVEDDCREMLGVLFASIKPRQISYVRDHLVDICKTARAGQIVSLVINTKDEEFAKYLPQRLSDAEARTISEDAVRDFTVDELIDACDEKEYSRVHCECARAELERRGIQTPNNNGG